MINNMYKKRQPLVLIVDDSKLMRYQIGTFLTQEGYKIIEAENGEEAINLFEALKPDIVLLDYIMPIMDGPETCQKMKKIEHWNDASVFMITSISDEESVNKAYYAGATDYITKPINFAVLRQRLTKSIEAQENLKELHHSNAFAQSIINYAIEGIITIDSDRIIRYFNPTIGKLFGFSETELLDNDISIIIPNFNFKTSVEPGKVVNETNEIQGVDRSGNILPLEMSVSSFCVEEKYYYTLIVRDITERKRYEEKIKFQAFYDALTGLPNRVLLRERVTHEINRAKRSNNKFALMYLDLDRFKVINDTLGHDRGDKLLKEMAERLKDAVRDEDLVVRMGGDEFVIILTDLHNAEYVGRIAEKILETVKKPIDIDGNFITLTISIGLTIFPDDATEYEVLLTNADIAMYRAKEKGKNNFQTFTPELNAKAIERLELENSLRRAIEYNEFVLHYQPKVNTKTGKIIGMEALIRWKHPKLGLLAPMDFIPMAEETGLIIPIGEWVLKTACESNKALQNAGLPPLSIAVNLSLRQFELQNLVERVSEILKESGLNPENLELEITESIAMRNVEYTVEVIKELQKIGVQFSIDDFGTGYSSLSQINNLAVNKLKIDKSFVSQIDGIKENSIIASTVLALGKNLRMQVIAEGVENIQQVNFLKDNDCDEMQGFYIAKPMSGEEFKKLYQQSMRE